MFEAIIEGTITLVILFLVLSHANEFGTVAQAIGQQYIGAVKVLQGR